MNQQWNFSGVTENYLNRYYQILDEMIRGMTDVKLTDSISHNFIVQMIPHHRAAIEMSHNVLQYIDFEPLRNIAANIITEQTISIENMMDVLGRCGQLCNSRSEICLYQRRFYQITRVMFSEMENAWATDNIDADFMREMIPHHRGAVRMSENALRFDICPELIPILQAIIRSQREGIQKMEYLLRYVESRG